MRSPRIFNALRRHRAGLGQLVLAWFVLAAATAGAAPCFAMSLAAAPAFQHDAAQVEEALSHHAHAASHDHSVPAAASEHSPASPCPHCPLAVATSGDAAPRVHSLCTAGDDVADGGKTGGSLPSFKYLPPAVAIAPPPIDPGPSHISRQQRPGGAEAFAVALNLRYCVFLI